MSYQTQMDAAKQGIVTPQMETVAKKEGMAIDKLPAEESFYTFLGQALCLFVEETNYKSSLSPFGIKI